MFNWFAKCQSLNILQQYNKGARMFDMRIKFKVDLKAWDKPYFSHGLTTYRQDINTVLTDLNSLAKTDDTKIVIRLMLEEYYDDHDNYNETYFVSFCKAVQFKYPNIEFYGGYRKWDFKQLYDFKSSISEYDIDQNHSSWVSSKNKRTWCIIPWVYAKLNNKKIVKQGTDKKYLMIDFV
jgi:hypothetical protein